MPGSKTTFGVQTPQPPSIRVSPQSQPEPQHRIASIMVRPLALAVHLAFAASLMATVGWAPVAHAQQDSSPAAQAQAENARRFDIPAGPLSRVLTQFSTEAGIFLVGATDLAQGKSSQGVQGEFSVQGALNQLLAGTGLQAQPNSQGQYVLQEAGSATTLPPVKVSAQVENIDGTGTAREAYRVENVRVGVLGDKSLKDTPYSIEAYSHELMENKQARSLADIAKGDAAVSLMVDNLVTENLSLAIRGLSPDFDTGQKIDGLNVRVDAADIPLEHLERIEILKGAGGFLYGFGTPGGIVNYVLKRPTGQPMRSLSTQVMDSGLVLVHGDVGGRLGADDRFGYRVNLVHESGDTYIDDGESRRNSGSIALDWQITPDLVWRVDALAGEHMRKGGYWGLVPNSDGAVNNWTASKPPAPIDGSERIAPSFARYRSIHETYGTDISWQFAPDWTLTLGHRYSENGREWGTPIIFSNAAGDYSLNLYDTANRSKSSQSQGFMSGVFTTGKISHELVAGASDSRIRNFNIFGGAVPVANIGNLSNPIDVNNPFGNFLSYKDADNEYRSSRRREIFVSDTLHLGEDWDIILGLRHSNLDSEFTGFEKREITPTFAAIFRPLDGLSVYGSYVEALEEGATAPMTAVNANEVFPPLVSKQYEVGAKAEGNAWSTTAALFRMERGLTFTTPGNVFTQDGEARYQGLEFNGKFRLSPRWLVTASAMWLDATNQKTTGGALDGKRIQGVARQQASFYSEYRMAGFPLTLTAGARYVGKRPVDPDSQWYVGEVTLFDIGARYETDLAGQALTLRLNVDNLSDEDYWVTRERNSNLQQGAPRTIKLGAQFEF